MSAEKVSVVCPVYHEADGLPEFYRRASAAMAAIEPPVDYELLFVDDGSTDKSPEVLADLASRDGRVRVVRFSRNFGHQIAITAGIDHADGDAVVIIDSDLQDPPEAIAQLVERWRAGYQVAYGQRTHRPGESRFKLMTAKWFYRLINRISEVDLPLDTGDFRLMDRSVVDALRAMREENRYMRGMVAWVGFRQCAVEYERDERYAGETKYTLRKMARLALDGLTSFSERPLRIASQIGALITFVAALLASWIVLAKVIDPDRALPGFASLMIAVLFLGGVQLLTIGLLGEYVGRIYRESKRRPLYVVAERTNVEPPDSA